MGDEDMKREDLIAPEQYNLTAEMEKYAQQTPERTALKWESEDGQTKEITYGERMKKANQIGNADPRLQGRMAQPGHRAGGTPGSAQPQRGDRAPTDPEGARASEV